MKRSYPALNFFIIAYKVIGIVVALCGVVAGILILIGAIALRDALSSVLGGALAMMGAGTGIAVIILSVLTGLGLVASGEWIDLHLHIEGNTRPVVAAELADAELRWVA